MDTHEFVVIGRLRPMTGPNPEPRPKVYRMKVYAPNVVVAKSRFWYHLRKAKKMKKANGEILEVHRVYEPHPDVVKNYGVWLRYTSRSAVVNMYKEYRDVTIDGAMNQCFSEMASRHRARRRDIQIIKTSVVKASEVRRVNTKQFLDPSIKFPLRQLQRLRPATKSKRTVFKAHRPNLYAKA